MSVSVATMSRARREHLSVPLALGLTVVLAGALHAILASRVPAPWVFPDAIRYSELAKSLGEGQLPSIRGRVTFDFGLGYPVLLAPVWAVFDDVTTAYAVAKVVNSVALALTALPAYFLARRFVDQVSALIAAALCVTIPSLLYAGTLMTEVALYPTFVLALLAVVLALERPTTATQLAALAAITLASAVKLLALTVLVGYVAAIFALAFLDSRESARTRLRPRDYGVTWFVVGVGVVVGLLAAAASGRSPQAALGAYDFVLGTADVDAIPSWLLFHVAAFDVFIAVIPFAATALVVGQGLRRGAERSTRVLAVLVLCVGAPLFASVAAYSSNAAPSALGFATGAGANERATFVLAPLALIGLMVWLRDRPGSSWGVVAAGVIAGVLPAAIPLDRFESNEVSIQAFSLVPWVGERDQSRWSAGLLVFTLTLAALFVVLAMRKARGVLFVAPVAVTFVAVTFAAQGAMEISSESARDAGVGRSADWIDRAIDGGDVSVLWYEPDAASISSSPGRYRIVWLNEFFNRRVGSVYVLGSPMPFSNELVTTSVRLDHGRVTMQDGRTLSAGLVLAPCFVHVRGDTVARDEATGATLYRVSAPFRASVTAPDRCA